MTSSSSPSLDTKKSTIILVTLCIHLCLGCLLFCLQTSTQEFEQATIIMAEEPPTTHTTLAPQKKNPAWGEMLARQGNFGIPTAPHMPDIQQEATLKPSTNVEPQNPPAQAKKTDAEQASNTQTPTSLESATSNQQIPRHQPNDQNVTDHGVTTNHDGTEHATAHQQSMPFSSKRKPLTLADIGQGFLAESRHNGTYGVTMEGKKGGHITDEQIKVERYVERLTWCLQNSLRIQRSNIESLVRTELSVYVFLELERSGTIRRLELIKSSGSPQLDQQTLVVFKDAGSSFPPVPTYLTMTPFAINYHVQYGTTSDVPLRLSFSR